MIRSYKFTTDLNKGKLDYIEKKIYPEWRRISKILVNRHMDYLYRNSVLCDSNILYKDIPTFLSERYKDCINRQVVGMIRSKYSNFKNRYKKVVMSSTLSKEEKKELLLVSKKNGFFQKENKLARWVFKNFFGGWPSTKNINMVLQDKIAKIEVSNLKTKEYFIKLCTDVRGKYIYIPVNFNNYERKFTGKLSTSSTLCFDGGKLKNIVLTKELPDHIVKENGLKISMDVGLNILFALDNGETYGKYFCRRLRSLDTQMIKLTKDLKIKFGKYTKLTEHGVYNRLIQRTRDYIKNEIGRLINKILRKHKPTDIIMEDLDFRGSKLNRKFNRLLSRFGLSIIKSKLAQVAVNIHYIEPSYTSQTCSCCGYVDKKNRKSQDRFICKSCGNKINADVNGSRNILGFFERFGDEPTYDKSIRRTLIVKEFLDREVWTDNKRIIQVLLKNPYFNGYSERLRERLSEMT